MMLMSPKELNAFRIDADVMEGLRRLKERDGVPLSVQVDRALRAWLEKKEIKVKPARPASQASPRSTGRSSR